MSEKDMNSANKGNLGLNPDGSIDKKKRLASFVTRIESKNSAKEKTKEAVPEVSTEGVVMNGFVLNESLRESVVDEVFSVYRELKQEFKNKSADSFDEKIKEKLHKAVEILIVAKQKADRIQKQKDTGQEYDREALVRYHAEVAQAMYDYGQANVLMNLSELGNEINLTLDVTLPPWIELYGAATDLMKHKKPEVYEFIAQGEKAKLNQQEPDKKMHIWH